jgi:energy-coupling factor transport system permease protein
MIISRLPIKTVLKGLEPVVLVIFITALLNLLWRGGETLVLSFWIINIYLEGIVSSIFMMMRETASELL